MVQPEVVVIGLGYIGLPTAALISSKGKYVYGVDINLDVVESINRGIFSNIEPELNSYALNAVKDGFLRADTLPVKADIYLIVVPTPFKEKNEPNISYIRDATLGIIPILKQGDLYIIESTSPVGTTEKMRDLIYSERPDLVDSISIAYCPERVLPGNIMFELIHNDRVIGGIDEKSTQKAVSFYSQFVKGKLFPTDAKTAEMCKLVENSSRDVQIAFANELAIICEKAHVDVWELIKLANKHPRVNILNPGSGVGGHCIAVDPYFLVSDFPLESKLINTARQINNYKSFWCVEKILRVKIEFELMHGKKARLALMGLAFKPNVDDLRESPARYIVDRILENDDKSEYFIVEPNIEKHDVFKLTEYSKAIVSADIIIFLVSHKEFINTKIPDEKIILDFCGALTHTDL